MIVSQAFAKDYTPTQPNALVSYDNTNKQFTVTWDFDVADNYTCITRSDVHFLKDMDDTVDHIKIYSFTPTHFSINSTAVLYDYGFASQEGDQIIAEEIPCTGSFSIDVDDLLSHYTNTENYQDLEIYTIFHVIDTTVDDFKISDWLRLDAVWMYYTATVDIKEATKDWDCDIQLGNAIYVDPYGIYGENQFACNENLKLENNEWVDIDSTGTTTYGFHSVTETPKKTGGGGCSGDCTPPTFFKNQAELLIVKNGFEFNHNGIDVINYHVPYDLITVNTNQTYNMKLKVYETNTLKWFQIGFGVPEVGSPLNDAESIATFHMNWDGTLGTVDTVDKHTLVDITNSTVSMVDCGYTESECYELSVDYVYRDQQKNNVVEIQACDMARNCATHYINDGILVEGESMNAPLISTVSVGKAGAFYPQKSGVVELTLINYKTDAWQDEYGYLWTGDNFKSFRIVDTIPVPIKEPDVMWAAMTRMNSNFDAIKQAEIERAILVFDASKLISEVGESWSYDLSQSTEQYNKELAIKLEIEAQKAMQKTQNYSNPAYTGKSRS